MADIPELSEDLAFIQALGDNPNTDNGFSAADLKEEFDKAPLIIQKFINEYIVPALNNYIAGNKGYLFTTGGKMTGPIDMSGQSIANLPDPEEEGDAVPLGYLNADVLAKMLASGYMVLSDKQYGAAFPEDAPDGTVFLVEVQE